MNRLVSQPRPRSANPKVTYQPPRHVNIYRNNTGERLALRLANVVDVIRYGVTENTNNNKGVMIANAAHAYGLQLGPGLSGVALSIYNGAGVDKEAIRESETVYYSKHDPTCRCVQPAGSKFEDFQVYIQYKTGAEYEEVNVKGIVHIKGPDLKLGVYQKQHPEIITEQLRGTYMHAIVTVLQELKRKHTTINRLYLPFVSTGKFNHPNIDTRVLMKAAMEGVNDMLETVLAHNAASCDNKLEAITFFFHQSEMSDEIQKANTAFEEVFERRQRKHTVPNASLATARATAGFHSKKQGELADRRHNLLNAAQMRAGGGGAQRGKQPLQCTQKAMQRFSAFAANTARMFDGFEKGQGASSSRPYRQNAPSVDKMNMSKPTNPLVTTKQIEQSVCLRKQEQPRSVPVSDDEEVQIEQSVCVSENAEPRSVCVSEDEDMQLAIEMSFEQQDKQQDKQQATNTKLAVTLDPALLAAFTGKYKAEEPNKKRKQLDEQQATNTKLAATLDPALLAAFNGKCKAEEKNKKRKQQDEQQATNTKLAATLDPTLLADFKRRVEENQVIDLTDLQDDPVVKREEDQ